MRLLMLVAAVGLTVAVLHPDGDAPAATPAATYTDGSFTQANSSDGMPLLTATNIGPGDSVGGSVTISNSGTLGGAFSLSARDLVDTPGSGGGALSQGLTLRLRDSARPGAVYDGPLTGVDSVPLGYFAPGEMHSYTVVATLPHGESDNAYAGSSTSVRLVWDARQGEPPRVADPVADDGRPSEPEGAATTPPVRAPVAIEPLRLRLYVPAAQRVLRRKRLLVRARCNRPCRIATRGSVRVGSRRDPLRTRLTRMPRVGTVRPRVRLPLGLRPAARRALHGGQTVVYRMKVSARDRHHQRVVVRRLLILQRLDDPQRVRIVLRPIGGAR